MEVSLANHDIRDMRRESTDKYKKVSISAHVAASSFVCTTSSSFFLNLSQQLAIFKMLLSSIVTLLSLLCVPALATSPRDSAASYSNLDSFIASERKIALQGVLNNIGPDGSKASGAGNYVIASPSKANPDCKRDCRCVSKAIYAN